MFGILPKKFFLTAGAADASTELNAFDAALLKARIGDTNLIKLSSILPPAAVEIGPYEPPKGSLVFLAYGDRACSEPGTLISVAVAVCIPDDPEAAGLIMECSRIGEPGPCEESARAMVREGMERVRGCRIREIKSISASHVVQRVWAVFAAVVLGLSNPSEWFTEAFEERTAFSVRYSRKLYDEASAFQKVEIFDTEAMGRVLILGGCFMVTERDAFIYHEMLVHPCMSALRDPHTALVIGGGDGGAVTELVKYSSLQSITLCEIDPLVISSCREHFPEISAGLSDPRVRIVCEDGAAFVREFREHFDFVLVDSTDPIGPGAALFDVTFYESVKASLTKEGAAVFQTESPLFMKEVFSKAIRDLNEVFGQDSIRPYLATVPCYPVGLWSFTFCSPGSAFPADPFTELPPSLRGGLRYYNPQVRTAAFALPECVRKLIES